MPFLPPMVRGPVLALLAASATVADALTLDHEKETRATLVSDTATLTGKSELHLTSGGDPIPGSVIHLESEDAWVFFHQVQPSAVVANLLPRIRVRGVVASADVNVRVVQYLEGAVVIPHDAAYRPLTIHTGPHFTGESHALPTYTLHNHANLGPFADNVRSFRLKRGYMATFAANENGTGASRNFVAQDSDLEISVMPSALEGTVSFVRVFPWRWVSKKGSCDVDPAALNARWHYNWNISANSTRDREYVAIKQQPNWPGLNQDWKARGINHLLGFNEPDNPVEDAYKNLTPPGSVANAVSRWPELLGTGLRVGAPAVTDGGYNWITSFIQQADAAGHRVDFVPVHYYRSFAGNDPTGAANAMYQFLKSIHDVAQRPIWVTEFNNGANWTNNAHDPDVNQNREVIRAMIRMMDETPWIERYAIYSRVEWFRQTHYDEGGLTPMGAMYRDHVAPMAYRQVVPNTGTSGNAAYLFDGHLRDSLSGNNPLVYGTPKPVPGRHGGGLSFDGTDDHLVLPGRLGDSTDFSFAAWVKWNGGANWQRIFDLGNGTDRYLFLTPKSGDNTLRFGLRVGGTQQFLNAPALTPGAWTHVAVTLHGNTGKLFVNGALVDTNPSMTLTPSQVGTETNYLGKSQWPADPLFSGVLDDVRFFNTGLSDAQVTALASSVAPQFVTSPSLAGALVDQPFTADLATLFEPGTSPVTLTKRGGPSWVTVSPSGKVFGVPGIADAGEGKLWVQATAEGGALAFAEIAIPVATGEPVVRYPFEGSPSAAVGTAHGVPAGSPGYSAGRSGQAITLDGVDDHIVLPSGVASSDEITIATWVRWNGGSQWQRIFDFGNGTGSYLFLTPRSGSNTLRFAVKHGGDEQIMETAAPLTAGAWTHVAVTLGPAGGKLYVNGTAVAGNPEISLRPSDFRPRNNYIGRSQWVSDPYLSGRVDDFHIFHRELASAEIAQLRNGTPPQVAEDPLMLPEATPGVPYVASVASQADGVSYSKSGGPSWLVVEPSGRISGTPSEGDSGTRRFRVRATSSSSPLLATDFDGIIPVGETPETRAHYEFHESMEDRAGGFHGTAMGSPAFTQGLFDRALWLDGNDDYVQLPAAVVSGLTDATFITRFRWDGGGAWQRVFDFGNDTTRNFFLTPSSGTGTLRFSITLGGNATQQFLEAPPAPVGEWVHVAVVLQGNQGSLYVNGELAATAPITIDPAQVAPTLNYIGKSQWPDPLFKGAVDDLKIIGRALDATEVRAAFQSTKGVAVPPSAGFAAWAAEHPFAEGEDGPEKDPDGDGLANGMEWLFGSDPLDGTDGAVPAGEILDAEEIGLDDGQRYFGFRARVRKERPGVTLVPEGVSDPADFGTPEAASAVRQAGPPVDDGGFEIFTWHLKDPIGESPRGFMRLRIVVE